MNNEWIVVTIFPGSVRIFRLNEDPDFITQKFAALILRAEDATSIRPLKDRFGIFDPHLKSAISACGNRQIHDYINMVNQDE